MSMNVYGRIKAIIDETNYAFSHCRGSLNIDYAEFAAMSLPDFQRALRRPGMTKNDLVALVRTGSVSHKA